MCHIRFRARTHSRAINGAGDITFCSNANFPHGEHTAHNTRARANTLTHAHTYVYTHTYAYIESARAWKYSWIGKRSFESTRRERYIGAHRRVKVVPTNFIARWANRGSQASPSSVPSYSGFPLYTRNTKPSTANDQYPKLLFVTVRVRITAAVSRERQVERNVIICRYN